MKSDHDLNHENYDHFASPLNHYLIQTIRNGWREKNKVSKIGRKKNGRDSSRLGDNFIPLQKVLRENMEKKGF